MAKLEKCPNCNKLGSLGSCGCPSRISKGVSFNLAEPYEASLLRHSQKQGSFSKYIKRLIGKDLN